MKNIKTNSNLIQTESSNAVLIKLPKSELMFWHPKKCVRTSGKGGYLMSIGYTQDWNFKVFRNGKGKYNRFEKIEEREMSVEEFESYFNVSEN
ncbi:MAG: hypothetical protein ACOC3T_00065 [Bacteroidota bacterium]